MRNKRLIRFQLVLLIAVVGLVIWRGKAGPSNVDGVVVFEDMRAGRLYRAGLRVIEETDVVISQTAAFLDDSESAPLATYGWILDSRTQELVWTTERSTLNRNGVLGASVDTIHISPGSYSVFYTTLGPTVHSIDEAPFLGLKPYWTNYAKNWHLSLDRADANLERPVLVRTDDLPQEKRAFENLIWTTGPVGGRGLHPFLFRVQNSVNLNVYAVGELCTPNCDYGWIEDAKSGNKIWQMEWENTQPAGGAEGNRYFDGVLHLNPGIYRAVFRAFGSHSVSNWHANPPFNPDGWGMTLFGVNESDVQEFDPWTDSVPFVRVTQVGNNEHEMVEFSVADSVGVLISALGEITSRGVLYDYGWLENNASGDVVWKMSRENSMHAGGDNTNRVENAFVDLGPGAYTIHFKTDGGHAFDNWSLSKPSHPNRWGVALFTVDRPSDWEGIVVLHESPGSSDRSAAENNTPSNLGTKVVALERVGNDADLYDAFELEEETEIFIIAQGEINAAGRWDYAWIESSTGEETVWEMTLRNTVNAGGADRNRRFEDRIVLPAGTYTARYVSDPSHSYGDFSDEAPDRVEDWGIRIFKMRN